MSHPHPKRKRYSRAQLAWQWRMADDMGVDLLKPSVMLLMRQLYAAWCRAEALPETGADYQQAAQAYGRIHDRLRASARR